MALRHPCSARSRTHTGRPCSSPSAISSHLASAVVRAAWGPASRTGMRPLQRQNGVAGSQPWGFGRGAPCRRPLSSPPQAGVTGMSPKLTQAVEELITTNKIVVFMKGTKQFPQCGFSNTVVQILRTVNAQFETINILENEELRSGMKEYSQVYIDGEFYGGCDIMIDAFQTGELQETLERVMNE